MIVIASKQKAEIGNRNVNVRRDLNFHQSFFGVEVLKKPWNISQTSFSTACIYRLEFTGCLKISLTCRCGPPLSNTMCVSVQKHEDSALMFLSWCGLSLAHHCCSGSFVCPACTVQFMVGGRVSSAKILGILLLWNRQYKKYSDSVLEGRYHYKCTFLCYRNSLVVSS